MINLRDELTDVEYEILESVTSRLLDDEVVRLDKFTDTEKLIIKLYKLLDNSFQ